MARAWPPRSPSLKGAGCGKVFQETASGARTDQVQLRKAIDRLEAGDTLNI